MYTFDHIKLFNSKDLKVSFVDGADSGGSYAKIR